MENHEKPEIGSLWTHKNGQGYTRRVELVTRGRGSLFCKTLVTYITLSEGMDDTYFTRPLDEFLAAFKPDDEAIVMPAGGEQLWTE
jgi:hypothetical protein